MIVKVGLFSVFFCSLLCLVSVFYQPRVLAQEASSNVVVQTIPGPTVAEKAGQRTKSSWAWYVTRGSGLVAVFSLVILMVSGIGQMTGYTYRFLEPLTAWATHRALGIAITGSIVLHIGSLYFDHFVNFGLLDLFIPWLSDYKPVEIFGFNVGSLYVALGVIAFYIISIITVTSLLWVSKKPHVWKLIHLFSYLALLFVFIHALYIGSDLTHGVFRVLFIIVALAVFGLILQRSWRAKTI